MSDLISQPDSGPYLRDDPFPEHDGDGNGVAGYLPPRDEGSEGSIPFRKYLLALRRRILLVLGIFLVGAGGAVVAWRTIEPGFAATGVLWVQESDDSAQGPITTGELLQESSWVGLLRSFAVLDSVVIQEGLFLEPDDPATLPVFAGFGIRTESLTPGAYRLAINTDGRAYDLLRGDVPVERGAIGDSIGLSVGFTWRVDPATVAPGQSYGFTVFRPRDAANRLNQSLDATMDQLGTFIGLQLNGRDPERIASVLNAVMARVVELAADLKRGNLDEQTAVLEGQLAVTGEELRAAERALEEYRVRTITLPSERASVVAPGLQETRAPAFANYYSARSSLEAVQQDRERLESLLATQPDSGIVLQSLELIPAVQASSELSEVIDEIVLFTGQRRELLATFTPEHPPVQQLTERIRSLRTEIVPALVNELLNELRAQEASFSRRVAGIGMELEDLPTRTIEEARLTRNVETAETLYLEVRQRFEAASLAEASSFPDVRILDAAVVTQVEATDNRLRFVAMILAGAVGLGIGLALLLDHFDGKVRYPTEIPTKMGLPILGTIPRIALPGGRMVRHGADQEVKQELAREAFRELRMNVEYAYGRAGPLVLAITSAGEGEGKSFITANLARSFAELGRRTLVIDGDVRRGDLHRTFEVARTPGLTDLLNESPGAKKAVRPTGYDRLHVLPSGSRLASAPELLGSKLLNRLFSGAREHFDVILVDTPPMGAGMDAFVLAAMAGHLVVVLRSESTDLDLAMARMSPLQRLPVRVIGAVLNDFTGVDLIGPTYVAGYLPGYGARDEEDDVVDGVMMGARNGNRGAEDLPGDAMGNPKEEAGHDVPVST